MANFLRRHERHDPPVGEIPVPHGPDDGTAHEHYPRVAPATDYEKQLFKHITHPDDSFTLEGVYWADLPFMKRFSFVSAVNSAETREERRWLWNSMKEDPLAPVGWYFRNAVLPGAGLGLEGYVLFSIGNLEPLFKAAWPSCWGGDSATDCSHNWISAVTYLEVIGIMCGQLFVGIIGDWIGRRWGLIQDAAIMFLALIMLTASWGTTLGGWVICYAWSLFIYGLGVGGEYPLTATSAMENAVNAGKLSTRDDRLHRGRKVTTAFLMQGWGQVFNQAILLILLFIFNRGYGDPPYSTTTAHAVFRISFAIPAIGTLWLVYYRSFKMKAAGAQHQKAKAKGGVTGYDVKSMKLCFSNFGGRLFATAVCWFCNDIFFYGNKLFQGQFISVISDNPSSLTVAWQWNFINSIVELAGYYLASFLIDNKMYGRKNMQQVGFLGCFLCFIIPAISYNYYSSKDGVHAFQAMYFLSSFFNQFGPNSVTFLVAGEVYPTQVRASAHGFSACIGKSGALVASILYNYIDTPTKFWVVPWFGLIGMLVTLIWLPDTTGLDLKEQERRFQYIQNGTAQDYHGIAIHPRHLSLWERWFGVGKQYHPDIDTKTKIIDMKSEWESRQISRSDEEVDTLEDDEFEYNDDIHHYFRNTPGTDKGFSTTKQTEKPTSGLDPANLSSRTTSNGETTTSNHRTVTSNHETAEYEKSGGI